MTLWNLSKIDKDSGQPAVNETLKPPGLDADSAYMGQRVDGVTPAARVEPAVDVVDVAGRTTR